MILRRRCSVLVVLFTLCTSTSGARKRVAPPSPLDQYIQESTHSTAKSAPAEASAGSLWKPGTILADAARDLRASNVDDLVTILVVERASAIAKGSTKTARAASAKGSIASLAGPTKTAGPLADMARLSGKSDLTGEGSTSRETVLSTTLSARVSHVLPNGYLVLEGSKDVSVNSERQTITVRGVARSVDLTPGNLVRSDRLAQLEIRVNGKGVVGDAIRRPFFLYRLLVGLLPF